MEKDQHAVSTSVSLPPDLLEQVRQAAASEDRSMSAYVRVALKQRLEENGCA